jgi:small subunit ribosomal protein S16
VGRKKQPSYRIVVAESSTPRGGAYVESVGFYNPCRQPAELVLDLEKVDYWLARGAEPTATAASLIRKARRGGDKSVALVQPAAAGAPAGAAEPQQPQPQPAPEPESGAEPAE